MKRKRNQYRNYDKKLNSHSGQEGVKLFKRFYRTIGESFDHSKFLAVNMRTNANEL